VRKAVAAWALSEFAFQLELNLLITLAVILALFAILVSVSSRMSASAVRSILRCDQSVAQEVADRLKADGVSLHEFSRLAYTALNKLNPMSFLDRGSIGPDMPGYRTIRKFGEKLGFSELNVFMTPLPQYDAIVSIVKKGVVRAGMPVDEFVARVKLETAVVTGGMPWDRRPSARI
jgi:hypothetical protein